MRNGSSAEALEEARVWLGRLHVGEGMHHGGLTLFPLWFEGPETVAEGRRESHRYVLLSDAIESGEAVVEEVGEGGTVPLLVLTNAAATPILVPEGEILVGGKQDRVINLTLLVAAGKRCQVPVSCVEQGRWRYASRWAKAEGFAHPRLRERKIRSAQRRRAAGGRAYADQGEVWETIETHLNDLSATSATRNMLDGHRAAEPRLEEYRRAIRLPGWASGLVAVAGGEVLGLDVFDAPATLEKLWKRIGDARPRPSPAPAFGGGRGRTNSSSLEDNSRGGGEAISSQGQRRRSAVRGFAQPAEQAVAAVPAAATTESSGRSLRRASPLQSQPQGGHEHDTHTEDAVAHHTDGHGLRVSRRERGVGGSLQGRVGQG